MNARRIPFQFSTTDPLARQRELEKRFGLQSTCPKMYVDVNNSLPKGTTPKETSSPRLQHRVPIFVEGYDQPIHSSSVDSMSSVPDNKKTNVRVIPIEIEGADSRSPRHRTYSGPADTLKDRCDNLASMRNEGSPFKRFNFENLSCSSKPNAEPRVYNIPIKIEGANNVSKVHANLPRPTTTATNANGSSQSKSSVEIKSSKEDEVQLKPDKNHAEQSKYVIILLKKIEDILTEFKKYESEVVEFNGTSTDKKYRYLDEMLTRCMLRLDDIDTMGNDDARLARKNAVKKIQASIDLLENKANLEPVNTTEIPKVQSTPDDISDIENNDSNNVKMQDEQVKNDNMVVSLENETSSGIIIVDSVANDIKGQSKASDSMGNNAKIEDENIVESTKILNGKMNVVTEIEMSEVLQDKMTPTKKTNLCEISNLDVKDVMPDNECSTSSLQQQSNRPEIFDEISQNNVISTNDAQSKEMLRSDIESIEQNKIFDKTEINDVEMLDEKNSTSNSIKFKDPFCLVETAENKSNINNSDVEMVEIGEIYSKKPSDKLKYEADGAVINQNFG